MKVFLLGSHRVCSVEWRRAVDAYVCKLQVAGYQVYYPPRDTDQEDPTGLRICQDNREAIEEADEVHVAWDGKSLGSLFDLGMAFALHKRVRIISGLFPESTVQKSFASTVRRWARDGDGA